MVRWQTQRERTLACITAGALLLTLVVTTAWRQQKPLAPPPEAAPLVAKKPAERPAAPAPEVVVDIKGAVHNEGVYPLPPGARVREALQAAGGLQPDADKRRLNQAKLLQDGQVLCIPSRKIAGLCEEEAAESPGRPTGAKPALAINQATAAELQGLPDIGPAKAAALVRDREANGPFRAPADLERVPGIGKATAQRLAEHLRFTD